MKKLGWAVLALQNSVVLHKVKFLNTLTIHPQMLCFRILVLNVNVQHSFSPYKMAWIFSLVSGKIISSSGVLTGEEEKMEEKIRTFQLLHFLFFPGL